MVESAQLQLKAHAKYFADNPSFGVDSKVFEGSFDIRMQDVMDLADEDLKNMGATIILTTAAVGPSFYIKTGLLALGSGAKIMLINESHRNTLINFKFLTKVDRGNTDHCKKFCKGHLSGREREERCVYVWTIEVK